MPKDTKTLGNSKARACESLGFVHKKGCARVLTQPLYMTQWSGTCLVDFIHLHCFSKCICDTKILTMVIPYLIMLCKITFL